MEENNLLERGIIPLLMLSYPWDHKCMWCRNGFWCITRKYIHLKNVSTQSLNFRICSYIQGKGSNLKPPTQDLLSTVHKTLKTCFVFCTDTPAHEDIQQNLIYITVRN